MLPKVQGAKHGNCMMQQYGTSETTLDFITTEQIKAIQPATIVDFGAGGGKYGCLLRETLGRSPKITAVDGFPATAEALRQNKDYDTVDCMLIHDWFANNTIHRNLAIFGDVLEHLTRREIFWTLKQAMHWFDEIIVVVPLFHVHQDTVYGNELETHRAFIDERYFDRLNPVEKHIIKTDNHIMMSVRINASCKPTTLRTMSPHDFFRWLMIKLERVGMAKTLWRVLNRFGLIH